MMDDDSTDYKITYCGETVGGVIDTPTYTVGLDATTDIGGFDNDSITINIPGIDDSPDTWPAEYKIKEMIELYPALKIQYEKFLEVYNLVKDDYKDELPF